MRYLVLSIFLMGSYAVSAQKQKLSDVFTQYEEKSFDTDLLLNQARNRSNGKVFLQLDRWSLELEYANIIADDYKFMDEEGMEITDVNQRPIPMNGVTAHGGQVSLTLGPDFIYGYIREGKETYYIEPSRFYSDTKALEQFIIYNSRDIKETAPVKCGVELTQEKSEEIGSLQSENTRSAGLCYDVEYAIVNDWSMYDKYGAAGLEARNIGITNDVNTNYKNDFADQIQLVITGQWNSTCSSCNPFGVSTNLNTTLNNFTSWGQTNLNNPSTANYIRHDVASLWSDVFANTGTIGLAWVGVICGSSKYNVLSDFSTDAERTRVLTSHELGHNFSARHDADGSSTIMAPSINITNSWSASSISSIDNHVSTRSCLSTCSDFPATVFFSSGSSSVIEDEGNDVGGSCQEPYKEYTIPVSISKLPSSNVTVNLSTTGSNGTNAYDFQLVTTSVTFTTTGALTQNIIFRIYDDAIVESAETLRINLSSISGPAQTTSNNSVTITINSDDSIESGPVSGNTTVFYGNSTQTLSGAGFFDGRTSDLRSRFIINASTLQGLGLVAGEIDQLAFYVYEKNTTGVFNNFRIGMTEITQNNLDQVGWLPTSTVFTGNIQTTESAWNSFVLTSPFEWDGISNIYVETCFDNSSAIGHDRIVWFSTGSSESQMLTFSTNELNNCGTVTNMSTYLDWAPVLLIHQKGATEVETLLNASSDGRIRASETANLFSEDGKIIASIKNTGNSSLQCITGTIDEAGIGRRALAFGSGMYTDKAFHIETSNNGSYELTLYFTEEELAIWGGEYNSLNFLRSTSPFSDANAGSSEVITTSSVIENLGAPNTVAYRTNVTGPGYFALTNGAVQSPVTANVASTWYDADLVIQEFGKGVVMKNEAGDQYLVKVNSSGELTLTLDNEIMPESRLPEGDLCIITPGKSLIIKRSTLSYTRINIDNDGLISTANTSSIPTQVITMENGHFGLQDLGSGIIFQNNQNECYKLYIDDSGNLRSGVVNCP